MAFCCGNLPADRRNAKAFAYDDTNLRCTCAWGVFATCCHMKSNLNPSSNPRNCFFLNNLRTRHLSVGLSGLLLSLAAQAIDADSTMLGSMHQRVGDEPAGTSADTDSRRVWGRGIYGCHGIGNGFQAGSDLFTSGSWRVGAYAGYLSGSSGSWESQSRYLGGYATWRDVSGFYVDTVLQGVNRTNGDNGVAASVEIGKAFALNETWSIEPRAQLLYQYHRNSDRGYPGPWNALWSYTKKIELSGRLGARVKGDFLTAAGRLQPYVGVETVGVSAGATLGLSKTVDVYGEIARHWSKSGEWGSSPSNQGSVGMKVRW